MSASRMAHEGFMSASRSILPRVGVGGGVGGELCGAIHACNPTRSYPQAAMIAAAAATPDRHEWMALRAIGGGC